MTLLPTSGFLSKLTTMYADRRAKGTVLLTLKRVVGEPRHGHGRRPRASAGASADAQELSDAEEGHCLIRATTGCSDVSKAGDVKSKRARKVKISTVVTAKDFPRFSSSLENILKAQCDGVYKPTSKKNKKIKKKKAAVAEA
jgi:hypothetical protein